MKRSAALLFVLPFVFVLSRAESEAKMRITSTAFQEKGAIPARLTCEGADVSPPLAWSARPPARRRSP